MLSPRCAFADILNAEIVEVPDWHAASVAPYALPKELIKYETVVEEVYDLEEDDEAFLAAYRNKWMVSARARELQQEGQELSAPLMELIVHRLEMLTGRRDELDDVPDRDVVVAALQDVAPAHVIEAVYGYWYFKRLRVGKALYRLCVPEPEWDNPNPFLTFRPRLDTPLARRRKLRDERQAQHVFRKLRDQMQSAASLLSLGRQREEAKHALLQAELDALEAETYRCCLPADVRAEVDELLRRGPLSERMDIDRLAEASLFRRVFPDPDSVPDSDDTDAENAPAPTTGNSKWASERLFGRDLAHLAYALPVRLPGVRPFLGVPRVSRSGAVVFDAVRAEELAALRDRLESRRAAFVPRRHQGSGCGEGSVSRWLTLARPF